MLSPAALLAVCVLAFLSVTCVSAGPVTSYSIGVATKVSGDPYFGQGSSSEWTVNGVAAPTLMLSAGTTYTFTAGNTYSISHHFAITTDSVVGASAVGVIMDITASSGDGSSFTWTPTVANVGTSFYYICSIAGSTNHQYLGNTITVVEGIVYEVSQKTKVAGDPYFSVGSTG
jgi:uncharacterized cupredoxin-like copper-binding protein